MNNAPVIVCLVMCIGFAVYARYRRNLEAAPSFTEFHLMHGPRSGCVECEGK